VIIYDGFVIFFSQLGLPRAPASKVPVRGGPHTSAIHSLDIPSLLSQSPPDYH